MASRTGAASVVVWTNNSIIDSHIQASTGDKMLVESLDASAGTTTLERSPIGSGLTMQDRIDPGATTPTVNISKGMDFDGPAAAMLAQLCGTENVSSLGSGAYVHSVLLNETLNTNYGLFAFHSDSANVHEYRNAAVTSFEINATPNDYLSATIALLSTEFANSATTNTASSLMSATIADSEPVITRPEHKVRLNAQAGGALSDSDLIEVTNVTFGLSREQELLPEIKGSAGNGAQRSSGAVPVGETISMTFKVKEDETWHTALINGTEYKMDFTVLGTLIGGSNYRTFQHVIPRLKVDGDPTYSLQNTGDNEMTVNFRVLAASSNPTGMISGYPYFRVINTRSTKYLK